MVSHLVTDIAKFEEELMREEYAHSAGLKEEINTEAIFNKYKHLFSKKHINAAKKILDKAQTEQDKRRARLLYGFLVGSFIGNKVKKMSDKAESYEAQATVKIDGKEVPYRQTATLMVNEDKREQRKKVYLSTNKVKKKLTNYDKKLWAKDYKLIKDITGMDYLEFCKLEKECDYEKLATQLKKFLVDTDKVYTEIIRKQMATINVPLEDAQPWDFGYLARAKHFDEYFPKDKLVETASAFWQGLGYDLTRQPNVKIDIEDREKKVPRAFCMPVVVPQEVVLVIKPHGGQDDYQSFLHESGHTEHFANTDASLPYELKHMGGHAVSESYAFLCEYLMANVDWLKKYIKMPDEKAKAFATFMMEHKLYFFRRYSAKVLYELKLHTNNLTKLDDKYQETNGTYESQAAMYVDILTKATKIQYKEDNYLRDVDSGMYSADYVRAWLFEVMLREKLVEKYGKDWFANKEAGQFLKSLWQYGATGKTINELAEHIGYKDVDISHLTKDFLSFFGQ